MTFTLLDLQLHSYMYMYAIFLPSRAVTAVEIEMRSIESGSLATYVCKYVQKIKDTLFFSFPRSKPPKTDDIARKSVSKNN